MMRVCATGLLVFAALAVAGCGGSAPCKAGTVMLTVKLPSIPAAGSVLSLTIADGTVEIQGTATLDDVLKGPLELDLLEYPQGETIEIIASIDDFAGLVDVPLTGSCATATMMMTLAPVDLSSSPVDLAQTLLDQGLVPDFAATPRDMAEAPPDM